MPRDVPLNKERVLCGHGCLDLPQTLFSLIFGLSAGFLFSQGGCIKYVDNCAVFTNFTDLIKTGFTKTEHHWSREQGSRLES